MPRNRRAVVVVLEPLSAAGHAGYGRSRAAEFHGQGLDEFRLAPHVAEKNATKPLVYPRSALQANRLRALGTVRELERKLARIDLFDERLLLNLIWTLPARLAKERHAASRVC